MAGKREVDGEATDAALLSRDDNAAFAELYRRHNDSVLAFFMHRTGCAHTSADLTAETFAAAFTSRKRFRDTGAPGRAWLFTIARRQLNRFIRRERVAHRARQRLRIPRLELSDLDIERIESLTDNAPQRALVIDALASIPATQADAVRLRVAEDLPYAVVAARLGCTEGAARVRVSRGLTKLIDAWELP